MASEYFDLLRVIAQPIRASALPDTLAHMERLLDALGSPQQAYRAAVVAGSTGKGTTCLRLAQGLSAAGLKVGLYTSPHLHLFRERLTLLTPPDRTPRIIPQAEFVAAARPVLAAQQALGWRYSTFETTTAVALSWFTAQKIDIAVLEVGIGGRFDAVNAVANALAVFTPIEAEHVAMLGGSLETVAWHKAGIIQLNGTAISVNQSPTVAAVLEREAAEKRAALHFVPRSSDPDSHSHASTPLGSASPGVSLVSLPGRLERHPVGQHTLIIDGGHTPAAAQHLRQFIGAAPFRLIVGMLRDKDAAGYLSAFDLPHAELVYTRAPGERALTSAELLARYPPVNARYTLASSLDEALKLDGVPPGTLVVVAGSLRMAAAAREAYGLLTLEDAEEARLTRAIFEGSEYQSKLK